MSDKPNTLFIFGFSPESLTKFLKLCHTVTMATLVHHGFTRFYIIPCYCLSCPPVKKFE